MLQHSRWLCLEFYEQALSHANLFNFKCIPNIETTSKSRNDAGKNQFAEIAVIAKTRNQPKCAFFKIVAPLLKYSLVLPFMVK